VRIGAWRVRLLVVVRGARRAPEGAAERPRRAGGVAVARIAAGSNEQGQQRGASTRGQSLRSECRALRQAGASYLCKATRFWSVWKRFLPVYGSAPGLGNGIASPAKRK